MAINKNIKSQFNRDYKNDEVIDIDYKLLDNGKKSYTIILGEPIVKDNVTLKDLYKLIQVIDKKVDDNFKELKEDVKNIDNRLSNVENDVRDLKEDVNTLKSEAKKNGWNV